MNPNKGEAGVSISKIKPKPKILLVDNEPEITTVLKKGLEQHGFQVETSDDPAAVAANHWPDTYDLLLLDIIDPDERL